MLFPEDGRREVMISTETTHKGKKKKKSQTGCQTEQDSGLIKLYVPLLKDSSAVTDLSGFNIPLRDRSGQEQTQERPS